MSIDLESLSNQDCIEDTPSPLLTTIAFSEEADLPPQMLLPVVTRTRLALYQWYVKEIKPLWKQDNNLLSQVPCSHISKPRTVSMMTQHWHNLVRSVNICPGECKLQSYSPFWCFLVMGCCDQAVGSSDHYFLRCLLEDHSCEVLVDLADAQ